MSITPFTKRPSYDWNVIQCIWAGTYVDGTPASGVLDIKYDGVGPMLDEDPSLPLAVFSTSVEVPIVTTAVVIAGETRTVGYASIWLPATNDPDIQGGGGTFTFTERLERDGGRSNITFVVDKDTPGGIIYLHKVAGSVPDPGTPLSVVYWSDFTALGARVDILEAGKAPLANPTFTGTVTLPASVVVPDDTFSIADTSGLQVALDAKVASTGLTETVQDIVGAMTVGGTGISVTYNDAAGSLIVTNTGSGVTPRAPHIVVASADAPATLKAIADYVCDGTADQVEINAAITAAAVLQSRNALMPAGAQQVGKVYLTGGRFSCSASVLIRTGVHLQGSGWGTELRAVGVTEAGLIRNADPNDHAFLISDLYLYGNWSSGGTCSGIDIDSTGSVNAGGVGNYPSTAPDNYYALQRLFIDGFTGGANSANRHGVYSHGGGYHRGPMALDLQIRNIGGNGIYWSSASDGFIANCHIGTVGGSGLRIATGNTKIMNCKTFYCDTWGLYITSGRGTLSGFESQDDASGVFLDGAPWALTAVTIDTWSTTGLRISSDGLQVVGASIFNRAGGRYATSGTAILWDAGSDACILSAVVDPTNVTTVISGTPGLYCRGEVISQGVGVTTIST